VKGLLADINVIGYVEALVQRMGSEPWAEFWAALGLTLRRFEDAGLTDTSTDLDIWRTCQAEQLVLITDNRNHESPDSLEATIQRLNQPDSLPVLTIGDLDKFRTNRDYVERVVESLLDYLLRIEEVRGAGRLYLP
jgi:hypothetical protein